MVNEASKVGSAGSAQPVDHVDLPPNPSGVSTVEPPRKDQVVIGKDPALPTGPAERSLGNSAAARLHGESKKEKRGLGGLIDDLKKHGPLDLGRLAKNYAAKRK